jgi:hypothetical protein
MVIYRWTINLALKTAEKMFYADTPFNSEDLVEVRIYIFVVDAHLLLRFV